MADVFEVANSLTAHAIEVHGEEIAIIAYYGSYAKGQASPTSDLDLFYMPDPGRARSLCSQFVIDGLPYDFWPVSWQFAEEIANARSGRPWAVAASLIADAQVLYHRSQADLERFNALKARIAALTRPENRALMVERALEAFQDTLFQLGQMRLAAAGDDRAGLAWAGWKFVNSAMNCLALANQTYFSKGWGANLAQVLQMQRKPADLARLIERITAPRDGADALQAADRLALAVRGILLAEQRSLAQPADAQAVFADFYFFIFEYKHKVLSACAQGNRMAAAFAAFQLQEELAQLLKRVANGLQRTDFNLLGEYLDAYEGAGFPDLLEPATQGDLETLARRVQRLDEQARAWFTSHAIELNVLADQEALQDFLRRRDPPAA